MKSNKKRKHPLQTCLLILLLILMVLVFAATAYTWSKLDMLQYDDTLLEQTYPVSEAEADVSETEDIENIVNISGLELVETVPEISDAEIIKKDDVTNILIIGTDERTKDFSTNARSDCMIVVSIERTNNTVKLVSLERGMGVPVLKGKYEGQYDWLTHIFRYGGASLLMETVEHCFKIELDHYVRFNFRSVTSVVDAVGGVEVELTSSEAWYLGLFCQDYSTTGNQAPLKTGVNLLDGGNSLAYARLREIDSDWQRVQRQRKVILGVVDALKGSSLIELNHLLDEVLPLIQTNLTKLEIAELMLYAPNLLNATFDQMTIPKSGTYGGMRGMGGRSLFAVDFETNAQILQEFLYGTE